MTTPMMMMASTVFFNAVSDDGQSMTTSTPAILYEEEDGNCTLIENLSVDSEQCLYSRVTNMTVINQFVFVIYAPVLLVITVLGLVGNTLAYVVMSKEMRPTCSSICLKALAVADNMVLVTFTIFFTGPTMWKYLGILEWSYEAYELLKPYLWFSIWFSKTLSVYIIVLVTKERYIAICSPLQANKWCTKRAARIGLIFIVVFDFAYNLPKIFQYKLEYLCDPCTGKIRPKTSLSDLYFDDIFRVLYTKALYFFIMFIYPLTVLFVLNCLLIRSINNARRFRATMNAHVPNQNDSATEKIIGVVIAFIILESPAVIINILYIFKDYTQFQMDIDWGLVDNVMRALYVVSTLNSCVNFYIYCLVGRRFRRILWDMLTGKKHRSAGESSTMGPPNGHHMNSAMVKTNTTNISSSSLNTMTSASRQGGKV